MSFNPSQGGSYRYNPFTDKLERTDVTPIAPAPESEQVKPTPKTPVVKPQAVTQAQPDSNSEK